MSQQEAGTHSKGGDNNGDEEQIKKHQQPSVADSEDSDSKPKAAGDNDAKKQMVKHEQQPSVADSDDSDSKQSAGKRMRTSGERKVTHQERWDEMFQRLKEFKRIHGHCRVPNRYPEDPPLGSWVSAQRRQYRIATTGDEGSAALTPDRANKLINLGFEWACSNPNHTPWTIRYEALKEFIKRFGHAEVPMRWEENPKLSHWVSKQRHDMKLRMAGKSSGLTDEKVKLLNDVGFRWEGSRRSLQKKVQSIRSSAPGTSPHAVSAEGESNSQEKASLARQGASEVAESASGSAVTGSLPRSPQGIGPPTNSAGHNVSSAANPQQILALLNAFAPAAAAQNTLQSSNNALQLSNLMALAQQAPRTNTLQPGVTGNHIQQLLNHYAVAQPAAALGLSAPTAPDPPGATHVNQLLSLLGSGNQAPFVGMNVAAGMQHPSNANQLQQLLSLFGPAQQHPAQADTSHQAQTNPDALRQLSLLMGLSQQQQTPQAAQRQDFQLPVAPSQGNPIGQLNYQGQGDLLSQLAAVSYAGNSVVQPLLVLPQSGLVPFLLALQVPPGSVQSVNPPAAAGVGGAGVGGTTVNPQGSPTSNRADPSGTSAPDDGSPTQQSDV